MITKARIMSLLEEALVLFGTYTFDDKGPSEVMSIADFTVPLRAMTAADAAAVLVEVARSPEYDGRGARLAEYIVLDLDDWDDLFKQPGINDIYNGEVP